MKFPTMKHPNSTALINCESSPHVTTEKKAILYRGGKSQTVIFFRGQLKYIENTTTQASANNSRKRELYNLFSLTTDGRVNPKFRATESPAKTNRMQRT